MILALLASATVATACPQFFANGQAPAVAVDQTICFTGFAVGYDAAWGEPKWSAEELTPASVKAGEAAKRNGEFHKCVELPGNYQVSPDVYAKSGFDLGHMTPAGDRGADKPETFGTCNMVPQRPQLNRIIWAHVERSLRNLALSGDVVWVVTGPHVPNNVPIVFLDDRVAVPTSTWKAVYDATKNGVGAWDCTNTATPVCTQETLDALTAEIGFNPLPGVNAPPMTLPAPTKGDSDGN